MGPRVANRAGPYAPVSNPPPAEASPYTLDARHVGVEIDWPRLLLPCAAAALVGGGAIVTLGYIRAGRWGRTDVVCLVAVAYAAPVGWVLLTPAPVTVGPPTAAHPAGSQFGGVPIGRPAWMGAPPAETPVNRFGGIPADRFGGVPVQAGSAPPQSPK